MDPLQLPEPWARLDPKRAELLSEELTREVSKGHLLFGETCTAVATCQRPDVDLVGDVLFRRPDGSFALVHLTWKSESDPDWPWVRLITTQAELDRVLDTEL